ncbi:hypothetical protein C8E95_2351 [Pseudonocardia autotrophica]|uniref:Uncharacterized protein n=2 Tax=Pseudonocardia TaxID=1847 RepID=A0A1Y2MJR9_PSEAH|nr:hypothetical protein BG845_06167 [Pseudonocardia autotrophica]TDN73260.1 hypothetical protein C8E95_2351 [Pseudonocardia autotrophica]
MEWIGRQGRDPLAKVLQDIARLRAEYPSVYERGAAENGGPKG